MVSFKLDQGVYGSEVKKTLGLILLLNWFVAAAKLVVGYTIKSTSMVADGYHSFADGASNIVGLFGMRIASQPVDADHPYGHKKYETFTSLVIALLLFVLCFHIVHDSLERLLTKRIPEVNFFSFAVLLVTLAINVLVMRYEHRKGKRIGSDVLVSDSLHTRADILTTLSVLAAFIGVKLGFPILDSLAALLIVVFIGKAAVGILRESSGTLCDSAALDSRAVEDVVLRMEGVRKCHRIRTRGRRDDIHVDLHVLVDDKMPLVKAHDMSSRIEAAIKDNLEGVTDVVVHMEPLSSEEKYQD